MFDKLLKEISGVKPLTPEAIGLLRKEAHESSPKLRELDRQTAELETVARIFRGKDEKE